MTAGLAGLGERIADELGWTSAGVASDDVVAESRVVARLTRTLVDIDAEQGALVFEASVAFARCHTVPDNAGSVSSAVHVVAGTLTDKVHAVFGQMTIGVGKTVDSDAASIPIVWISCEQASLGAVALTAVVDDGADGVGAAGIVCAGVDAPRDAGPIASGVLWTVDVSSRTLSWIRALDESISDESVGTSTREAAERILANCTLMARMLEALVDVFASVRRLLEARFTVTVVERAHLVDLAVVVRSASELAVTVDTELSSGAFAVAGARRHTEIAHASFSDDAAAAGGAAAILKARQTARTVATTSSCAGEHGPRAADLRRGVADESVGARTVRLMIANCTDGVGAAQTFD